MASESGKPEFRCHPRPIGGWGKTWIPEAAGMTSGVPGKRKTQNATLTARKIQTAGGPTAVARPADASHRRDDLGPDGDHAQKQRDRGQCGGFFDDGAKHDVLPERKKNIVHCLFYCQAPPIKAQEFRFPRPLARSRTIRPAAASRASSHSAARGFFETKEAAP